MSASDTLPAGEVAQRRNVNHQTLVDLAPLCDQLRELHRQRQDLHRAEKSLTLQIKAKCRRLCSDGVRAAHAAGHQEGSAAMKRARAAMLKEAGKLYDAMLGKGEHPKAALAFALSQPFIQSRALLNAERKNTERSMAQVARQLPVARWTSTIRGLGIGSLAAIVGECGDLSRYSTVAKLWKRLGLATINGERQQKKTGAEGILHGYAPSRRSVMWNAGQAIFKAQSASDSRPAGYYREVYDQRKVYEVARGITPPARAHNRSTRYMEKRLVKHLWQAWRTE